MSQANAVTASTVMEEESERKRVEAINRYVNGERKRWTASRGAVKMHNFSNKRQNNR